MKKLTIWLTFGLAALTLMAESLLACDITVSPEKSSVLVGDTVKVLVHVHLTHRKCVLPIEETEVEVTNGKVLSHTPWKKTARMDRESIYTVVFYKSGKNRILVTRECSREGLSEGMNYVNVTYTRKRAIEWSRKLLKEISEGKRVKTNSDLLKDVISWIESQKNADEELKKAALLMNKVVEAAGKSVSLAKNRAREALNQSPFKE